VGPKELDIKLEEFEARLTMINRELQDLVKTAKDIEFRAKVILGNKNERI
jgi:ribosomal protein S5